MEAIGKSIGTCMDLYSRDWYEDFSDLYGKSNGGRIGLNLEIIVGESNGNAYVQQGNKEAVLKWL